MAQSRRLRIFRNRRQEHELRIIDNPLNSHNQIDSSTPLLRPKQPENRDDILKCYDYQAPLTANALQPNSRWLIVRRNLHRIRFMGLNNLGKSDCMPDLYLGFQMTRELKRAQEEIKNIDKGDDFRIIKEFSLASEGGNKKRFNTSHVTPEDALIYDRLGEEPLALRNLLFYFSKQDIQHGSVFWEFLNEVNHVLNLKRKRTVLVQRLRRIAFVLAVIFYSLIGLMFILLLMSLISTTMKFDDPEVAWMNENIGGVSSKVTTLR